MLSVVVPCYNEADGLKRLESELFSSLVRQGRAFEVLTVDDGSSDSTWTGLQEMAARRANLRLLRHEANRGLGAALRTGLAAAQGDWLIFLDADLTFHPDLIDALWTAKEAAGADCASGSPFLGGMGAVPWRRRLPSLIVNSFYRGLFDRALFSYTPMFRLYRTADLKALDLRSEGFEISAEILTLLIEAGRKIIEVPAPLSTRVTGVSKLNGLRELRRHVFLILRLLASR